VLKPIGEIFAANVRRLRKMRGWNQPTAAEKAGMSPRGYASVELGERFPREENIAGLSKAFEVAEWELFMPEDAPAARRPSVAEALEVLRDAHEGPGLRPVPAAEATVKPPSPFIPPEVLRALAEKPPTPKEWERLLKQLRILQRVEASAPGAPAPGPRRREPR
jgi:transcriptional regulator with XRE-family HTH domain